MKQVQIHYREPNGDKGVINYLTGDNVEVSENKPVELFGKIVAVDINTRRGMLKAKAQEMAGKWASIFPDTKFTVMEV